MVNEAVKRTVSMLSETSTNSLKSLNKTKLTESVTALNKLNEAAEKFGFTEPERKILLNAGVKYMTQHGVRDLVNEKGFWQGVGKAAGSAVRGVQNVWGNIKQGYAQGKAGTPSAPAAATAPTGTAPGTSKVPAPPTTAPATAGAEGAGSGTSTGIPGATPPAATGTAPAGTAPADTAPAGAAPTADATGAKAPAGTPEKKSAPPAGSARGGAANPAQQKWMDAIGKSVYAFQQKVAAYDKALSDLNAKVAQQEEYINGLLDTATAPATVPAYRPAAAPAPAPAAPVAKAHAKPEGKMIRESANPRVKNSKPDSYRSLNTLDIPD